MFPMFPALKKNLSRKKKKKTLLRNWLKQLLSRCPYAFSILQPCAFQCAKPTQPSADILYLKLVCKTFDNLFVINGTRASW